MRGPSKKDILGTAFIVKCCCGVIVFLLGNSLISSIGFADDRLWIMVAIASCALFFQAADVIDYEFQSQLSARSIVTARSSAFVFVSGIGLLVLLGAPLILFAATPGIEAAMAAALLITLMYLRNGGDLHEWRFKRTRAIGLVKTALPIAISGFFVVAIMQIDKLMLSNISGSQAVGIYSAASLLSTAWYMVPVIVGASVSPSLTRLYADLALLTMPVDCRTYSQE